MHRQRRGRRTRAIAPVALDDQRHLDRHTGRTDTYDVTALGYNYRLDEPRAALLLSRLNRLEAEITRRRD